jgi:hypothetical protein
MTPARAHLTASLTNRTTMITQTHQPALRAVNNRDPYAGVRVAAYRNLHKGAWSIRPLDGPHKGTVVAHAGAVATVDCRMHVNTQQQQRIANGGPRQVHAWIIGTLADVALTSPQRLTYRPHQRAEFFLVDTGEAVWDAHAVVFTTDAAYIDKP